MKRKRDSRLIEKRNKKICARYYYWTELQRLRSDSKRITHRYAYCLGAVVQSDQPLPGIT